MHKLESNWTFSYYKPESDRNGPSAYESCIHTIGKFSTCEDFWAYYSHIKKPSQVNPGICLHLFRNNMRPMWEDEDHKNGGSFLLRVKKMSIDVAWEILVLNLIGEKFPTDVTGVRLNQKKREFNIQVWHRTSSDNDVRLHIAKILTEIFKLKINSEIEYKKGGSETGGNSGFVPYRVTKNGVILIKNNK